MFKIKANNGTSWEVKNTLNKVFINNLETEADIIMTGINTYHIVYNDRSYNVNVLDLNPENKTCILLVNGKKISLEIKDKYDELLEKMGMTANAGKALNELKAPMPGLVLKVLVTAGDKVEKGDSLLLLEAMKMENILKSTGDGIVKKIHITEKDKVEKGQLLISF